MGRISPAGSEISRRGDTLYAICVVLRTDKTALVTEIGAAPPGGWEAG